MKFSDVWDDLVKFQNDYKTSTFYDAKTVGGTTNYHNSLTDDNIKLLFALLVAKYGNNTVANSSREQFKLKVFSIVFQYGPTWQKELQVQDELRSLSIDELIQGGKTVYNHAFNDATAPSTGSLEEIAYINEQNTQNYKKSKLNAFNELMLLLHKNVTETFIQRFKVCFVGMVGFVPGPLYVDEEEEE